jgi:hypothetical protein
VCPPFVGAEAAVQTIVFEQIDVKVPRLDLCVARTCCEPVDKGPELLLKLRAGFRVSTQATLDQMLAERIAN